MPKDLFFTLSKEKQSKIINAAIDEFSKEVYQEASINQIVKKGEISRGSFYQYFDDKDDLYFYILENIIKVAVSSITIHKIETTQVSILSANRALFIFNLNLLADKQYEDLFRNLFLSMNQHLQQKFKKITDKWKEILLNTTYDKEGILEEESRSIKELMNILELINRDLLTKKIVNGMDDKSILELYDYRIQVLSNLNTLV